MLHNDECEAKGDNELVIKALTDSAWFFCLATRYEEKLLRYILRITGARREDAEDMLQDIFVKTYQNLNSFDDRLKFSSWIYRIAHNTAVSAMRKSSVRPTVFLSEQEMQMFSDTLNSESAMDTKFDREAINKVLPLLDTKYREVLTLRYLEEKEYIEISDILKKPVSTVGNLISRGKRLFREEYIKIYNKKNYD